MGQAVGQGGFFFPKVYRESKEKVAECLKKGIQDLIESSRWSLADEFVAFILRVDFLSFADKTYPNPRKRNFIPVWFVICCQFVMKIHLEKSYLALGTLLKSGPVLSRIGFNVRHELGFNELNKYDRETPVHQDAVRKFFKDTDPKSMREWFNVDLQKWFGRMGCFDTEGVYILDQSHLVVPRNDSYADAVYMPVDEHGQQYAGLDKMGEKERKALKYHPCYTLSTLLHLSFKKQAFHVAAYEFGPGNEDELPQARRLIETFFKSHKKGDIKLLIADRGYVCGKFITWLKEKYGIDTLIPLKGNMHQHTDAIALSKLPDANWVDVSTEAEHKKQQSVRACIIEKVSLWDDCQVELFTTVCEVTKVVKEIETQVNTFTLCSTRKFDTASQVVDSYRLRTLTEEAFRHFKRGWKISDFPSPDRSLLEAHVGFTLTTYSLLQLYLMRNDLQDKTHKMIQTLKREMHSTDQNLLVYADQFFARFSLKEFFKLTYKLPAEVQDKLAEAMETAIHQR